MKAILFFFISIHFLTAQDLKLTDIQGRWYVIQSNFPMWLSGKKTNPTFNYTIMERKGDTVLLDEVKYLKKGKNKTIVGYDKTLDDSNTRFIWRGKGLLFIAKSKWEIIYMSDNHRWAIIHFKKTLFTPEGYDVISRNKAMDYVLGLDVKKKLEDLSIEGVEEVR